MAIFAVLQRHLSPSAFLLIFVAPIGALRIIAFGDFPAGVDMRRSGALYQVINRKERRRAEARLGNHNFEREHLEIPAAPLSLIAAAGQMTAER
jgi:hypothetical protein